jgi:hypothetical protein
MNRRHLAVAVVMGAISVGVPTYALGTSGGLDSRGGHHCWTRCASQGKYTGQYHCHRSPCNKRTVRAHRRHDH